MGEIIQFPSNEADFLNTFNTDGLPVEFVDCLKSAYNNVIKKQKKTPSCDARVYPESADEMRSFTSNYQNFMRDILGTLLIKEVEICQLKWKLETCSSQQ